MWDYTLSTYKEEVRNISVRNIRCKYYVDFDFKYSVPQHTYTISECTHYPRYLISKFDCTIKIQKKNMADNYFITVMHQVGVVAKGVGEACLFVTYSFSCSNLCGVNVFICYCSYKYAYSLFLQL